jgi:CheY-like chemotaxis protein
MQLINGQSESGICAGVSLSAKGASMSQKNIVIADDNPEVVRMLSDSLRAHGYAVTGVLHGKEVLELCRAQKADLVILDIAIPDMDGYSVAQALRNDKELEDIPIVFLTGVDLVYRGIEKRMEQLDVHDYFMKPCRLEDLAIKVKGIIG